MLDDKTFAELKQRYGQIAEAEAPNGETVAVKKPSSACYRAYIARLTKDSSNKEAAIRDMVRECVVFPRKEDGAPDGDAADALFDEFPGLPLALSGSMTEMVGTSVEVRILKN